MTPKCIAQVNAAAAAKGRQPLTQAELNGIDSRMKAAMRRLARQDRAAWHAMPLEQRVNEAAALAMGDMRAEAARKVENAQRQVLATATTSERISETMRQHSEGRSKALVRDIDQTSLYIEGVKREAVASLMDTIEAANTTAGTGAVRRGLMWLFDAENPQMTRDLVSEIFGNAAGGTGNAVAKAGAKAWLDAINGMRERFNGAGGDVGKLDYGYLPQPHDTARVRAAGAEAWTANVLPKLDRSRYVLEDGTLMSNEQVSDLLRAAYETISTDGLNKTEPDAFKGSGARANRGSDSRQIHFKDGQSYLDYMGKYGSGSMYDAMIGHVSGLARDIGLVERYGPNPNAQFRLQLDLAQRADGGVKRSFGNRPEAYWDIITGVSSSPESARIAQIGQDARNIQTFGKLAGAVLSSVTDFGTFLITANFNKLPYWEAIRNVGRVAGSGEVRDFLTMHGIIAESMVSDLNRWAGDNIRNNWSGRLANSTMKLSLMNAWTDTLRRGFSMTMMRGLGKLSRTDWGSLTEWDRTHMQRAGITEDDWAVMRTAQLTDFRGEGFLTPEAIRASGHEAADQVVAKVLGFITDESEYAVLNPDLATKAVQSWGGTQRGTYLGELARTVMQFKSFPIAMISRHWRRMLDAPQSLDGAPAMANRLAYGSAMMLSLTVLGGISQQAKQIAQGKDPRDMTDSKFWGQALAQGGGLSIVGDLLFNDPSGAPGGAAATLLKNVAGPTVGSLGDLYALTVENAWQKSQGKDTHIGAEAVRFGRSHLPYVNLWYGKRALDAAGLAALQENLSPGYLSKMQQRAQKEWGQGMWWKPGDALPERAPDFANAVGG